MTEPNGIYPDNTGYRRHEDDCIACLEPWACDCICRTCTQSRKEYKNIIEQYATCKEMNPEEKENDND